MVETTVLDGRILGTLILRNSAFLLARCPPFVVVCNLQFALTGSQQVEEEAAKMRTEGSTDADIVQGEAGDHNDVSEAGDHN